MAYHRGAERLMPSLTKPIVAPSTKVIKASAARPRYPFAQIKVGETWLFRYDDGYDPVLVRNAVWMWLRYAGRRSYVKLTTKGVEEGILVMRLPVEEP